MDRVLELLTAPSALRKVDILRIVFVTIKDALDSAEWTDRAIAELIAVVKVVFHILEYRMGL
jgi:hypothetical protein